ncbi:Two-component sensor histidine kinase [Richelia intracellularis HM01]|uniref:ATP-binding protein n=1 Tax=Richelia intracellularis TaxID=1164990 RepID=UPI0002B5C15E|nr:ATP-binding protein [Richelia intracellularis]CCH65239.1 Two-component sensor histidine kinase [Richelia intracellularis HM01]
MNVYPTQDISFYKLALESPNSPEVFPLTSATLLSLVMSQIDLLIEYKITATLWVKLPPESIWQSEIVRYHTALNTIPNIYSYHLSNNNLEVSAEINQDSSLHHLYLQLEPDSKLKREYFFVIISPELYSVVIAYRPEKKLIEPKFNNISQKKTAFLLGTCCFQSRIIQRVVDGIYDTIAPENISRDLILSETPKLELINKLLIKQIKRQDEISRQVISQKVTKLQKQNQNLQNSLTSRYEYLNLVCQKLLTPLTHMKTALSLLNSSAMKATQRQRYLQMINNQCDRQNALINGVRELVQIEKNLYETDLESVHILDVVPGVISTYQPLAQEKGIMLAYTIPNELPAVQCVSGGLRQILINLIANSIKFSSHGGQVWVRTRVKGNYVQLEVKDTGIGIAENELSKIFDSFYQVHLSTTEDPGGAGLGLTVVQQLLQVGGGSITVTSKLMEGSTFTVNLPKIIEEN